MTQEQQTIKRLRQLCKAYNDTLRQVRKQRDKWRKKAKQAGAK